MIIPFVFYSIIFFYSISLPEKKGNCSFGGNLEAFIWQIVDEIP